MTERIRGDGLFPPAAYGRDDDAPDARFYEWPRKVVHIDDGAMSRTATASPGRFRALGVWGPSRSPVATDEMADNPQLARHLVHDVNRDPSLPFPDATFDGAMCAVSIQYVLHPLLVLGEVHRVLRPGAPFVVAFSNRCFPTKAAHVWLGGTDEQHVALVRAYFDAAGGWDDVREEDRSPGGGDPLYAVWARKA